MGLLLWGGESKEARDQNFYLARCLKEDRYEKCSRQPCFEKYWNSGCILTRSGNWVCQVLNHLERGWCKISSLCDIYRLHCCAKGGLGVEVCMKMTSSPSDTQRNPPVEPPRWDSRTVQAGRKSALVKLVFAYPEPVHMAYLPSVEPFSFSKTSRAAHISASALFYLGAARRKWIWTSVYLSSAAGSKAKFHFSTLGRLCSISSVIWNLLAK